MTLRNSQFWRKRKPEESVDESHRVEAAASPPSVRSPPRTRARWEAVRDEEEVTVEVGRSTAEKAASAGKMQTPPALPPSLPMESPARELFAAVWDQALPGAYPREWQEAGRSEVAGLVEEILAATRRTAESADVSAFLVAM